MPTPPVVLFDLDGTLTDPEVGITNAMRFALDRLDRPAPDTRTLRRFIGPPLVDSFASLGLDASACDLAVQEYRRYFAETGLYENRVYEGIEAVLDTLVDDGFVLGVATSKAEPFAVRILAHFGLADRFAVVAGATLDGSLHHKHEVIAAALTRLGRPEHVMMVGDREHDVIGARTNGLPCIGVAWGFAEPGELEAAGAVAIVDDRPELVEMLRNLRTTSPPVVPDSAEP